MKTSYYYNPKIVKWSDDQWAVDVYKYSKYKGVRPECTIVEKTYKKALEHARKYCELKNNK